MLGLRLDFATLVTEVLMEGAEGSEKRLEDAAGERCSAEEREEEERTEKRG